MDLSKYYNNLYINAINNIKHGKYTPDSNINSKADNRRGITLAIRLPQRIADKILSFQGEVRHVEPNQYYYPNSDMHITVLSIISCYNNFQLSQISIDDYLQVIGDCLNGFPCFDIEMRGITASPECAMVQGFFTDTLTDIRNAIRRKFASLPLQNSIDRRYAIATAHSTIVRLKENLQDAENYIRVLGENRNRSFGQFTVSELQLVYNDWYQRKEHTQLLGSFRLKNK